MTWEKPVGTFWSIPQVTWCLGMAGNQILCPKPNVPSIPDHEKRICYFTMKIKGLLNFLRFSFIKLSHFQYRTTFIIYFQQIQHLLTPNMPLWWKNKFWHKLWKFRKTGKIPLFYSKNSSFSKFCIVGTFGLGINSWFPGIPTHQLT